MKINHILKFVAVVACLAAVVSQAYAQQRAPRTLDSLDLSTGPGATRAASTPDGWTRFTPQTGEFTASFPTAPEIETQRTKVAPGLSVVAKSYSSSASDESFYFVGHLSGVPPFPNFSQATPAQRDQFLSGVWKGIVANIRKGMQEVGGNLPIEVISQRDVIVMGQTAREVLFSFGPFTGRTRMIPVNQRVYVLMAIPVEEGDSKAQFFFDSFEIQNAR